MTLTLRDNHLKAGACATCGQTTSLRMEINLGWLRAKIEPIS